MDRLTWLVLAVVLLLSGVYLYLHLVADWLAFLVMGVGAGIGIALTGTVIHDAFAGQRERRQGQALTVTGVSRTGSSR